MTKLKTIILIVLTSISILILTPQKIHALEEWKEVYYCENTLGLVTFKQADSLGLIKGKKAVLPEFVIDEKYDGYCIDTKFVNDIMDRNVNKDIEFCGIKGGVNYFYALKREGGGDPDDVRCCPEGYPYIYPMISIYRLTCCKYKDPADCSDNKGADEGFTAPLGSQEFPPADKGYSCEDTNCFTNLSNELLEDEKRTYLSDADKSQRHCYASVGVATAVESEYIIPGNQVCFNGKLLPLAEYERWGSLIGLYATCMESPNVNEQQQCVSCYEACVGYSSCPLIYNSMGCIDTNPQGLITRVFQIGIGVIGAVGIVRIMQAAFMRQSGDPAKLKESYDIISSVVIGAILLIFGIVILRFIGINVLQILPFDFLQ